MGVLLTLLIILFIVSVAVIVYDKVLHPFFFKEELEGTLEDAAEEKIRKEVNKKAQEIIGGNDVDIK